MSAKKLYLVLSPVLIAGEITKEGTVECEPDVAQPLLGSGSLKEFQAKPERKENAPTETSVESAPVEPQAKPAKKAGKKTSNK